MNRIANTPAIRNNSADELSAKDLSSSADELNGLPLEASLETVARSHLSAEQQAQSFQATPGSSPGHAASLTNYLGPLMTVANPVWGHDSLRRMRKLQKRLIEHSLTLDESDRGDCMQAIMTVENSVRLRLRYEQMRMSMAEMEGSPGAVEAA